MKNKYIFIIIIFLIIFSSLLIYKKVNASNKLDGIDNFPSNYQPYLRELVKKHPNWRFTALHQVNIM